MSGVVLATIGHNQVQLCLVCINRGHQLYIAGGALVGGLVLMAHSRVANLSVKRVDQQWACTGVCSLSNWGTARGEANCAASGIGVAKSTTLMDNF